MQPCNWLKTKKKIMDQTSNDTEDSTAPFFAFNHMTTSKKQKKPRTQLSHVFSTPLIGTFVWGGQSKEEGKGQWMNAGEEKPESEAELECSLKGLKVSHEKVHKDEAHYDPDYIFALLNSAKKPEEGESKEEEQDEKEADELNPSQEEDRISIFTFAAKESKIKQKGEAQKFDADKKLALREYRQTRLKQAQQNSLQQNPLLHLHPRDYQAINGDSTELQLLFTKRQDPFFKRYCEKSYEPRHNELREKLKAEMLVLMKIRQGSYLANVVLGEVLEECLRMEQEEREVDGKIAELERRLKEGCEGVEVEDGLGECKVEERKLQEEMVGLRELALSEKESCARSTRSSVVIDSMSDGKSKNKKNKGFVSVCEDKDFFQSQHNQQVQGQQSQLSLLDEQIAMLKAQTQRQGAILLQQTQQQAYLQSLYLQQQNSLHQAISHKQLTMHQLHTTQTQLSLTRKNLKTAITTQHQTFTSLQQQLQHCLDANNQKLSLMLENLFDVVYVQLQILANQMLKNLDKAKWRINLQMGKQPLEMEVFMELYQVYIKEGLLMGDKDFARQFEQMLSEVLVSQDQQKYTHLYSQFQKRIKAYLCFVIESQRTKHNSTPSTAKLSFAQQLFNLLDTNSYHSQTIKEGFFKLPDYFVQYGQEVFSMLLQEVMKLGEREEGEMGRLLIGIGGKERGQIERRMEEFTQWLEGLLCGK